jgi:hypothetical protein
MEVVQTFLPGYHLGVFHRATPVPRFCPRGEASLGRRLLGILRQVHNRQHPLKEDAA